MMSVKHYSPYTLGLDIGMASVGWCLLTEDDILAMGVRAFDKAEAPDGAALNATRREKRLMRRRLRACEEIPSLTTGAGKIPLFSPRRRPR